MNYYLLPPIKMKDVRINSNAPQFYYILHTHKQTKEQRQREREREGERVSFLQRLHKNPLCFCSLYKYCVPRPLQISIAASLLAYFLLLILFFLLLQFSLFFSFLNFLLFFFKVPNFKWRWSGGLRMQDHGTPTIVSQATPISHKILESDLHYCLSFTRLFTVFVRFLCTEEIFAVRPCLVAEEIWRMKGKMKKEETFSRKERNLE